MPQIIDTMCHGPSQSESNFINTVIKQEGNYFKYWKNVRVGHEFGGYHILSDTQWINDSKEIYSEIICTLPPTSRWPSPLQGARMQREITSDSVRALSPEMHAELFPRKRGSRRGARAERTNAVYRAASIGEKMLPLCLRRLHAAGL